MAEKDELKQWLHATHAIPPSREHVPWLVDRSEKRTERIVARVPESMLERVAALARASDRKIADWAYLVIKREVERAEGAGSATPQEAEPMMSFTAHVRNGRLILDAPIELPEGTHLELVSVDDVAAISSMLDAKNEAGMITSDTVTDEHVRWYQESMPDSPTTRDVILAATSDLAVLRWLGRRRIAAAVNARAKE